MDAKVLPHMLSVANHSHLVEAAKWFSQFTFDWMEEHKALCWSNVA